MSETIQEKHRKVALALHVFATLAGLFLGGRVANAQQMNQAWTFTAQNRASIAALMQQVENQKSSAAANSGSGYAGYTNLICGGGDGTTTADGNSTCIILNNTTGSIEVGQDSEGLQSATNTTPQPPPQSDTETTLSDTLAAISQ